MNKKSEKLTARRFKLVHSVFMSHSHVINAYLVEKYAKDKYIKLYPKDPAARAVVDHKLHFDTGVLFPAYRGVKVSTTETNIGEVLRVMAYNISY
jgi:glutathione S-transferase